MTQPEPRSPEENAAAGPPHCRARALLIVPCLALGLMIAFSALQAHWLLSVGRVHNNDFKHVWLGSWLLARGLDPYDPDMLLRGARGFKLGAVNPFVYLPAAGLLTRPLSVMEFPTAARVWFWFDWALAWACVLFGPWALRGSGDSVGRRRPALARWLGACFIVGAMPFYRQMTAGQMNIALLAMILASVGALARGRDGIGGSILGVAAAYKISPLFLIVSLVAAGRARAALWSAAVFTGLCVAAEIWAGAGAHAHAWPTLRSMGYGQSTWAGLGMDFHRDPFNQSFNSLFHHLFSSNPHTAPWVDLGPGAANALTGLVSVGLLAIWAWAAWRTGLRAVAIPWYWRRWRSALRADVGSETRPTQDSETRPTTEPLAGFMMISTLLMLLLPSLMWDHYAVQALAPMMWLVLNALAVEPESGRRGAARAAAFWGALALAFWALSWPWPHQAESFRHGPGVLLMSLRLWGVVLLFAMCLRRFANMTRPAPPA